MSRPPRNSLARFEAASDGLDHRLTVTSLVLGLAACLGALVLGGSLAALSFLVGATLSFLNFIWLRQGVDHLVQSFRSSEPPDRRAVRVAIFKYFLRYVLIGLALYAIVRYRFLEVAGFFSGLFLLVAAVLFECVVQGVKGLIGSVSHGAR